MFNFGIMLGHALASYVFVLLKWLAVSGIRELLFRFFMVRLDIFYSPN